LQLIAKEPLLLVAILAIFYFLLIFVVSPIYLVFKTSLIVNKQFNPSNYLYCLYGNPSRFCFCLCH
jgi:iron(III) transport system permease protein